jgi:hypothetical protein
MCATAQSRHRDLGPVALRMSRSGRDGLHRSGLRGEGGFARFLPSLTTHRRVDKWLAAPVTVPACSFGC